MYFISFYFQALLSEFHRFRMEEVPPRLRDKQRLAHLYEELQVRHLILLSLLSRTVPYQNGKQTVTGKIRPGR